LEEEEAATLKRITGGDRARLLAHLDAIRSPRSKISFTCTDSTQSRLCGSDRSIRRDLAALSPWAVTQQGDAWAIWLGVPGQVVTEVRYTPSSPNRVIVDRRIPAPF